MTNNEAAKWIQLYIDLAKFDPTTGEAAYLNDDDKKTIEAMEMAIAALEKEAWKEEHPVSPLLDLQPCKQDDLISRAAAQTETHEKRTETHACDCIRRWDAIDMCKRDSIILDAMDSVEDGEMHRTKRAIVRILAGLPAADVVEVKRGKWIPVTNGRGGHECSICHLYAPSFQTGEENLTPYCPNCGADMRGEQDG